MFYHVNLGKKYMHIYALLQKNKVETMKAIDAVNAKCGQRP
jgi:hypothetical protein